MIDRIARFLEKLSLYPDRSTQDPVAFEGAEMALQLYEREPWNFTPTQGSEAWIYTHHTRVIIKQVYTLGRRAMWANFNGAGFDFAPGQMKRFDAARNGLCELEQKRALIEMKGVFAAIGRE